MIARTFLFAGILVAPMLAGSQVMAQPLALGSAINEMSRAPSSAAPSASEANSLYGTERSKLILASSRGAPAGKPARKKHPASRSQDND